MTDRPGIPARELSDEELERQGVHAHAMRHWVADPVTRTVRGVRCHYSQAAESSSRRCIQSSIVMP